jgi:hypothetical protein
VDVSFGELPEIIRELRIWWINAGVFGILLGGGTAVVLVLAWRSPELLKILCSYRTAKKEHEERTKVLLERLDQLEAKRTAKQKAPKK